MTISRICFIGDGTLLGCGDERAQGWTGRLCAHVRQHNRDFTCYNLGVRYDTSADVAVRWKVEAMRRLSAQPGGGLVFSFGNNDMAACQDEGVRVPLPESLANAEEIMTGARDWLPTLWIGPLPALPENHPLAVGAVRTFRYRNDRIFALNDAYADLAATLGIPYLDVFSPLLDDPEWVQSLAAGGGRHPDGRGHNKVGALMAQWPAWLRWMRQQPIVSHAPPSAGAVHPPR